jgi:hypothetical protein
MTRPTDNPRSTRDVLSPARGVAPVEAVDELNVSDPNWPYKRFPYGTTGIYAGCRTVGDRLRALADHEDRRYADPGRDA